MLAPSPMDVAEETEETADDGDGAAGAPDPAQCAGVEASLKQRISDAITINYHIEPDLIGGLRLRIGGTQVDGSVRRHLDEMKQRMLAAPVATDIWDGEPDLS